MLFGQLAQGSTVSDRIVLTIPSHGRLRGVATLVLGGLGGRLDLPYERMDDLQLAVLSALDAAGRDGDVSLEVDAAEDELMLAIGPVRAGASRDTALSRVLTPLVDELGYESRGGSEWLTLRLTRGTA
jgi:hypothetical protein